MAAEDVEQPGVAAGGVGRRPRERLGRGRTGPPEGGPDALGGQRTHGEQVWRGDPVRAVRRALGAGGQRHGSGVAGEQQCQWDVPQAPAERAEPAHRPPVGPVGVVHDDQQGLLACDGEEVPAQQRDEFGVAVGVGPHRRGPQGTAGWGERAEQLGGDAVPQPGLGGCPPGEHDPGAAPFGGGGRVQQQRGAPAAGGSLDDPDRRGGGEELGDDPAQDRQLGGAVEQVRPGGLVLPVAPSGEHGRGGGRRRRGGLVWVHRCWPVGSGSGRTARSAARPGTSSLR